MENLPYYLALLLFSLVIFKHFFHRNSKLPPNPFVLPIIGHLHLIKNSPQEALNHLSSEHGPILFLRFGSRPTLVVSSPSAVEECFTKNDVVFANRPRSIAGDYLTYNYIAVVWAPYSDLWRSLCRLAVVKLFSSKSLQKSSIVLEQEIRNILSHLMNIGNREVDLEYWFTLLTFNMTTRLVAGDRCVRDEDAGTELGKRFVGGLKEKFLRSSPSNLGDYVPILRWIDYGGVKKSMVILQKKRDEFLQGLIDQVRRKRADEEGDKKTLIGTLLCLQESEPDFYTDDLIKSLILYLPAADMRECFPTAFCNLKSLVLRADLITSHMEVLIYLSISPNLEAIVIDAKGRFKATDAGRLRAGYNRLVEGLAQRGNLPIADTWLSNPALPDDILKEAVPGNIRRAEHFLSVLRRLVQYLKGRLQTENVENEGPVTFVASINAQVGIDQKVLRFCYDRLHSLMMTLEITDTDEFLHIQTICDFATLVGTYTQGFSIIIEPFDERMPNIPDPVLQVMFLGGTGTSIVTMERAVSFLLNHPSTFQKARAEIDNQVGHRHLLDDSDLSKLPFLECVINETLRLYPPAPHLLPHYSSEDCTVRGFEVPRGTTLLVNASGMHRDPKVWEEPDKFKPERFEGEREGFKFVPFGIGRRACPGANMGVRAIFLALGSLIQCFELEEVREKKSLIIDSKPPLKAEALEVVCIPRKNALELLSQFQN